MIRKPCFFRGLLPVNKNSRSLEQYIAAYKKNPVVHESDYDSNMESFLTFLYNQSDNEYKRILSMMSKAKVEYNPVKRYADIFEGILTDDVDIQLDRIMALMDIYKQRRAITSTVTDKYLTEFCISSAEDMTKLKDEVKNGSSDLLELCVKLFDDKFQNVHDKYLVSFRDRTKVRIVNDIVSRLNERIICLNKSNDKNNEYNNYKCVCAKKVFHK